jgi:hypothetical protein
MKISMDANGATGSIGNFNYVNVTGLGPIITASPTSVAPGGTVTVSWSGVASPTVADWFEPFASGASDSSHNPNSPTWRYTSSCTQSYGSNALSSGSCSYTMPTTTGTYEFRLFANDSLTRLAVSPTITVG